MDKFNNIKSYINLFEICLNGLKEIINKENKNSDDLLKLDYLLNGLAVLTDEAYKKLNKNEG